MDKLSIRTDPMVHLRVEIPAEQVCSAITLYQEDIAEEVTKGVQRALMRFSRDVENLALKQAEDTIREFINLYFEKEGNNLIQQKMTAALEKIDITARVKEEFKNEE